MLQELKFDTAQVQRVHEPYNYTYTIPYQGRTLTIQYGKYGNDLVLFEEDDTSSYEVSKAIIEQIGKGFNALLSEGKYQEEFTEVPQTN
jgi:hypothetical protein